MKIVIMYDELELYEHNSIINTYKISPPPFFFNYCTIAFKHNLTDTQWKLNFSGNTKIIIFN